MSQDTTMFPMATVEEMNSIPIFEPGQSKLLVPKLKRLGRLLVKYQLQDKFGVGYLHRHSQLKADTILIHEKDGDKTICVARSIHTVNKEWLRGYSLCLLADTFKPYDFHLGRNGFDRLEQAFLEGFRLCIQSEGIAGFTCLVPRLTRFTIEYQDPQINGTTAWSEQPSQHEDITITEWNFDVIGHELRINEQKGCKVDKKGEHKTT